MAWSAQRHCVRLDELLEPLVVRRGRQRPRHRSHAIPDVAQPHVACDPKDVRPDPVGVDATTMNLFARATGRRSDDRSALPQWQRECVTRLVADVREALKSTGRAIPLSVAVFADVQVAREKVRQDWPEWCRRGLVDAVVPMNYTDDDALFAVRSRNCVAAAGRVPVVMAVGVYKCRDAVQVRGQIDAALTAGAAGVGMFNWRSLFGSTPEVPADRQRDLVSGVETWLRGRGAARRAAHRHFPQTGLARWRFIGPGG